MVQFAKKTGLRIFQRKVMFQHPLYPWMLADLDYLVELPDGSNAILEIKTTNYNARENWWYNGEEIVPIYYESQGRHYMAVMNIDRVYFCCLYGNSEDEAIIRRIDRDMAYSAHVDIPSMRAKEEFESPEGKELLKSLGIEGDYEGIGHCVLGYIDGDTPKAAPRRENRVYYVK